MNGKELLNFANKLEDDHKDRGYKWLYDKLRYEIIKKHQEAINYTPCCTELNNCLQKGDSAYIYENAIVDIISVLPNNEYIVKDFSGIQFTADKKDLTKII